MWVRTVALVLSCLPAVVFADFIPLDDAEMTAALTDQALVYPDAVQTFYASGRTLYDAGRPSWGYWRVEAGQYCSQWPPSDLWACYDMARDGDVFRFIAEDGSVTDGALKN
jgi:hypothetical protein